MTTHTTEEQAAPTRLASGSLNAFAIAFLVLAVAAPIGAITGPSILGVALGNGIGMVGTYAVVTLLVGVFAVGYAAISRHVDQTGAFYRYVQQGLGNTAGGAAALIALLTYTAALCTVTGAFGFFGSMALGSLFGAEVPWWLISVVGLAIIAVLGRLRVGVSSSVLVGLMILELVFFAVLDGAVITTRGLGAFDLAAFAPSTVFSAGFPIAIMFAIFTFAGVEVAAIYSEEASPGGKSVGKATFGAIALIGVFYMVTVWCLLSAMADAPTIAAEAPGDFTFIIASVLLGDWAGNLLLVLVVISLFSSMLALHQSLSRYMLALGRDRLLPAALGKVHGKTQAPANASVVQVAFVLIVVAAFAIAQVDPLLTLVTSLGGVATIGTLALWILAGVSIVVFFRRMQDRRWWTTVIAPSVSAVAFLILGVLAIANYPMVTGVQSDFVNSLWALPLLVGACGAIYALYLKRKRPGLYAAIGTAQSD